MLWRGISVDFSNIILIPLLKLDFLIEFDGYCLLHWSTWSDWEEFAKVQEDACEDWTK